MKRILFILLLITSNFLIAQKFTIEGFVKNQETIGLEGATVFVQSIKDSIVLAYGITNKNGKFSFNVAVEEGQNEFFFNIGYIGYKPINKIIKVPDNASDLNLGAIILDEMVEELQVVTVISRAPPILIKKDTIEYNADSFKTLPNDKAEDLLKKLPGVEIDADGLITVNGIEVQAINVDGMYFFGEQKGDIALKNIPSNAISKVQVTDYKTDMQKFTGEESDSGTKEINLKIKKGKNTATFGDFNGGYGTDEKYQANGNIFKLIEGKQLGVIAGTNNINMSNGFNSLPDTDTSNGYIESDFLGTNFSKGKWNETRINSDYRYSSQNIDNEQISYKENFLPDLNYTTNTISNRNTDSDSHDANLDIKFIVPSKNEFSKNRSQLSNKTEFNNSNNTSLASQNTESQYENGDLVSDYSKVNEFVSTNYNLRNNFNITSRVGPKNRDYFDIGLTTNFTKSNSDSKEYSENILYQQNTTIIQDQISDSDNTNTTINLNALWNKKITNNFRIIPRYSANVSYQDNQKKVYDYNDVASDYSNFNNLLSLDSKYIATTVMPVLALRYDYKDFRFEVEGIYTNTFRKYEDDLLENRNFKADFQYFTYSGRARYKGANGYRNIDLRYNQNVNLPSVSQLQPVKNVSNITHIITGNPLLKPSINHNIPFRYNNNLAFNNININGEANAQFSNDKIINATYTDEDLIKNTTYTNTNGDYSLNGSTAISKSYFNKKTNININFHFSGTFKNNISIQNNIQFVVQNTTIRPSVSFKYSYDKKLDLSTSYSYSSNKNVYKTDMYNDSKYFVQNLRFDASLFFFKNVFLSNKVAYSYNSRVGDNFDGDAVFWNTGLGVELWKNKATLTLVGYDILNKNNGFRRSVSETYIQDVENKILKRYFMVTFTYKFGKFAGQNINVGVNNNRRRRR